MAAIGRWRCGALALGLGVVVASWGTDGAAEPPPAGWKLVWSDEFDGNEVDKAKWDFDVGNGFHDGNQWIAGWGNDELQYYTSRSDNVFAKGGLLHIRGLKESLQGFG